jgi:hypothetical protein
VSPPVDPGDLGPPSRVTPPVEHSSMALEHVFYKDGCPRVIHRTGLLASSSKLSPIASSAPMRIGRTQLAMDREPPRPRQSSDHVRSSFSDARAHQTARNRDSSEPS